MTKAFRLRLCGIATLFCLSSGVFSQATARWLSSAAEAKPYASISARLVSFAETVAAAGVDEKLYLDRLIEGVRKRAPAERIEKAMEEEASRLVFLAGVLDSSGLRMSSASRDRALIDGSLVLRASVSREEFAAAARTAAARNAAVDRVGATLSVLASVDPGRVVDSGLRLELAESIALSSIKTDRIDSIAAVFSRGRSFGLLPDRIARIVVTELASGGSLSAIDSALNRERIRR